MDFETCRRAHLSPRLGMPGHVAWRASPPEECEGLGEDVTQDEPRLQKLSVVLVEEVVARAYSGEAAQKKTESGQNRLSPEDISCGVSRRLQLTIEGFWEFLFSERWPETALLRVLGGELLDNLLVALYQLELHHDVISFVTLANIDHERLIKQCSKTAMPREQHIYSKEVVLVELDYWCPQHRIEGRIGDTRSPPDCTEGLSSFWSPVNSEVSPSSPEGEPDAAQSEDGACKDQNIDTPCSVRCNIRGLTRPLPHTDCCIAYHMIREPFLVRRQREGRVFPSLQVPQARPNSSSVQSVDDQQKKQKEEKLSKEDMMQLGPHLEDGTEMVASDPLLEPLPPELCSMLNPLPVTAASVLSPKQKSTPSSGSGGKKDQKKPAKTNGYESDSLTDEEADRKKCQNWIDPQRKERIEDDLHVMQSDLHVSRSDGRSKLTSMKSRLCCHLRERQRERSRRRDILPSSSYSPSAVPLKNDTTSDISDPQHAKVNRWSRCPTFAEFYSWMLEHPVQSRESSTPPDKRKTKKEKSPTPDSSAQKSSPKSGSSEGAKEGKGKKEKGKPELKENVKDSPKDKAKTEGQGEEVGQRETEHKDKEGLRADKQSRETGYEQKEKTDTKPKQQDKNKRDGEGKKMMTMYKEGQKEGRGKKDFQGRGIQKEHKRGISGQRLQDMESQQVDRTGVTRGFQMGDKTRYNVVPWRRAQLAHIGRFRQRQHKEDEYEYDMPPYSKRKQHGKAEFTLRSMSPANMAQNVIREKARLGMTPSGTHLLTPEQMQVIRDAGLIISDEDPWHISIRFAYLASGMCDSIGMLNSLLSRRARILRLMEDGRLIYKLNESRLWNLVRVVPAGELCEQEIKETGEEEGRQIRKVLKCFDPSTSMNSVIKGRPMWKWVGKYQPEIGVKTWRRAGSPLGKIRPRCHKQNMKELQSPHSPKIETIQIMAKSRGEDRASTRAASAPRHKFSELRQKVVSLSQGKDAFKQQATSLSCESYWVKRGTATPDRCGRQGKNVAVNTTENIISFTCTAKNKSTFLAGTPGEVGKDKKSDKGGPFIQKSFEKHALQTSISDVDNLTEDQLFALMELNKIFEPTKLKSSYSFEKLFAGHQDRFSNYNKLLSEFQKPFKGKEKSDKLKKDKNEKKMSLVEQQIPLESSVITREVPTEVLPSEQMVIGKLRKFNFLKYRDYTSGTVNIGQPPCNAPTLEEMCIMLERAMQTFVVRKERATTTQQFQTKVSVTFTRRQPPDAAGVCLVANTNNIVSSTCNTLSFA